MATNPNPETVEERLTTVAESLGIPQNTIQITQVRLNRLESEPDVDEEALEGIAAAALALSSREDGLPITDTEILEAWREVVGDDSSATPDPETFDERVDTVAGALEIEQTPPQPSALLWAYGDELDLDDELVAAATRLFRALFEASPGVVANGTKPQSTVAAILSLTADLNDVEAATLRELGDVSDAGEVTVRNRYRDLSEAYENADLDEERFEIGGDGEPVERPDAAAAAADGNGDGGEATAVPGVDAGAGAPADAEGAADAEEAPPAGAGEATDGAETAGAGPADAAEAGGEAAGEGSVPTAEAVEDEIDALADELSIDPSVRLFARGMISDAVSDVGTLDASELAAAAIVAGSRREDADVDASDVAAERPFTAREISRALDALDEAIDVDIPRREPADVAGDIIDDLDLADGVQEESDRVLEAFESEEGDYTARELGAGAVFFAATVTGADVDVDDVADATGAGAEYVTDAMNEILIAQCLGLVRGDIAYAECTWTEELLESDLAPTVGDSADGRAVSVAKTYVAGREGEEVDEGTLDALLGEE